MSVTRGYYSFYKYIRKIFVGKHDLENSSDIR